jgi:hypothetical protein
MGQRVVFRIKQTLSFTVGVVSPRPTPKLQDHPLSAVRDYYSMYSQLSSMPGGRLLHPQPEDAPCYGDSGPT